MEEREYPAAGEQRSAAELMKEEYLRVQEQADRLRREYEEQKRKEELAKIVQVPRTTNQPEVQEQEAEQTAVKPRKTGKKWLLTAALAMVLVGCIAFFLLKPTNGWKTENGHTYFYLLDGEKATGWQTIDGSRYYFGQNGVMRTGWEYIKGDYYYFGSDGRMRTGTQVIDGRTFYFGTDGKSEK